MNWVGPQITQVSMGEWWVQPPKLTAGIYVSGRNLRITEVKCQKCGSPQKSFLFLVNIVNFLQIPF